MGVFDVGSVLVGGHAFVHGYLSKYRPQTEEEVAVPETRELGGQTIENLVTAKSRFFLHMPSLLIAYHPVGNEITRDVFCSRFAEVFQAALGNFFVNAEIQGIEEPFRFREILGSLDRLSQIKIYLHPSNPHNRDLWRRTDERLKQLEAGTYAELFEARKDGPGLKMEGDEDIEAKVSMAEDGYGRVDVKGSQQGVARAASTHDNPLTALAPWNEEPPEAVAERLLEEFRSILGRFQG